jgi:hypothetical protein
MAEGDELDDDDISDAEIETTVVNAILEFVRAPDEEPAPEEAPFPQSRLDTTLKVLGVTRDELDDLAETVERAVSDELLDGFEYDDDEFPVLTEVTVQMVIDITRAAIHRSGE